MEKINYFHFAFFSLIIFVNVVLKLFKFILYYDILSFLIVGDSKIYSLDFSRGIYLSIIIAKWSSSPYNKALERTHNFSHYSFLIAL